LLRQNYTFEGGQPTAVLDYNKEWDFFAKRLPICNVDK
jgi:hypothetical protein